MIHRTLALLLMFALFLPTVSHVQAAPAAETTTHCTNWLSRPTGQDFWVGEPATANANGPVVVFVHGYLSDHYFWNVLNDAVQDACNQGFRVAAVDLGRFSSIWDNGRDLTQKLRAIAAYYGVAKVNIIAHSKGGVDTQTAIVHYGAGPLVQSYMALGTPFGGTDLADHACSWYGSALWQCNDATWNLRTGYMSYVRAITDGRAENQGVRAYAARGTQCDWYVPSCLMISGASDAVVPAWSVWANGVDTHISDRADLMHHEVGETQYYDRGWLFSHLGRATTLGSEAQAEVPAEAHRASSNYTLRGGLLTGKVADSVTVEGGLSAVHFTLLSTQAAEVAVVSPSGERYESKVQPAQPGDMLQGLFYTVRVAHPEAGTWQVLATPTAQEGSALKGATPQPGYLLRVTYEGGVTIELESDLHTVYQPGSTLPVSVVTSGMAKTTGLTLNVRTADHATLAKVDADQQAKRLVLPQEAGTYNIDLQVTGVAADGTPFERTLVSSIAVVDLGASPTVELLR